MLCRRQQTLQFVFQRLKIALAMNFIQRGESLQLVVIGAIILGFAQALVYIALFVWGQPGKIGIALQLGEVTDAKLELPAQAIRWRERLARSIILYLGQQLANAGVVLRAVEEQESGQSQHSCNEQHPACNSPKKTGCSAAAAFFESACSGEGLTKQLGHAIRLERLGRRIRHCRLLDSRRPHVKVDAAKRRSACRLLPRQEFQKMSIYPTLALLNPILPEGERVAGPGEQIRLGQHQEDRQAGHGGALSPVVFEQAEEPAERGKGVVHLAGGC